VHGIALAQELGKGFTSNGRDSTVTVFDLRTLAKTGSLHVTGRFVLLTIGRAGP
jgi:hypothetical protein